MVESFHGYKVGAVNWVDCVSPAQARHERRPGENGHINRSPFFLFCPEYVRGKTGKREVFIFGLVTPGGAALARGYYHIVLTGLRFGALCSQIPNSTNRTKSPVQRQSRKTKSHSPLDG